MEAQKEPPSEGTPRPSFVEILWSMDEKTLIQRYMVATHGGDQLTASEVIRAKAMLAAQRAAEESRQVAHWTKWLAFATGAMAGATLLLVLATELGWGAA